MGETIRFGISIDDKLLKSFDNLIEQKGYLNRSEAIRDLIRASLVELKWERVTRIPWGQLLWCTITMCTTLPTSSPNSSMPTMIRLSLPSMCTWMPITALRSWWCESGQ